MTNPLLFSSTNLKTKPVTFSRALLKGLAPDKGLFMPEDIPQFSSEEIVGFSNMEYYEIALEVIYKFLKGEIEKDELKELVKDAYNYDVPLELVYDRKYILRLDQGPTASFKDFAARMMGRLMAYYLKNENHNLLILTATSGDTGSAIANAFYGLKNIKVLVLFPEKEVTQRQRKQMTTLGNNIQIVSVDGKFDDCQALVKEAFSDSNLDYLNLSSANSINIGRLIPQIVYYFYSYSRLRNKVDEEVTFSIPSGNFGDMMGGMLAKNMGLPVKKFVIATNKNDEFTEFLKTGTYNKIDPSINCISSAMNVGHPSNISRLISLYGGVMDEKGNITKVPDMAKMRNDIFAVSVDDSTTKATIKEVHQKYNVLLEPHGSVSWKGLSHYLEDNFDKHEDELCISLETAHPAKFPEEIIRLLDIDPELPASLMGLDDKPEHFDHIGKSYDIFKNYLKQNY